MDFEKMLKIIAEYDKTRNEMFDMAIEMKKQMRSMTEEQREVIYRAISRANKGA